MSVFKQHAPLGSSQLKRNSSPGLTRRGVFSASGVPAAFSSSWLGLCLRRCGFVLFKKKRKEPQMRKKKGGKRHKTLYITGQHGCFYDFYTNSPDLNISSARSVLWSISAWRA